MSTCLHGKQHCSTCLPKWDTFLLWEAVVRKAIAYYREGEVTFTYTGNYDLNDAVKELLDGTG